jgi:hypothetical protein
MNPRKQLKLVLLFSSATTKGTSTNSVEENREKKLVEGSTD